MSDYDGSKYTIPTNWCESHWCYRDHAKELDRPGTTNYGASFTFVFILALFIIIIHYVALVDIVLYCVTKKLKK